MHFKYLICTESVRNKYWTRKYIFDGTTLLAYEDKQYNLNQINKLISYIDEKIYFKINDKILPQFQ